MQEWIRISTYGIRKLPLEGVWVGGIVELDLNSDTKASDKNNILSKFEVRSGAHEIQEWIRIYAYGIRKLPFEGVQDTEIDNNIDLQNKQNTI